MQINIEYDKEINQIFLKNGNRTLNIDRTEIATVEKIFDSFYGGRHRPQRRLLRMEQYLIL